MPAIGLTIPTSHGVPFVEERKLDTTTDEDRKEMLYSNEDMLKAIELAFEEGFKKGRIAGADHHYYQVSIIRYLNWFRKKLGMPELPEPDMEGH